MPKLSIEGLRVTYGQIIGTENITFGVDAGETVALIGSNGAGKSSTLKAVLGMVTYRQGKITLDGRDLKGMKPSTRQRFVSLSFDFPEAAHEEAILVGETGVDAMVAKRLVGIANALRALRDHDLEEVASTRLLVYAATLIKDGCDPLRACRAALVETLTDDPETAEALNEVVSATFGR